MSKTKVQQYNLTEGSIIQKLLLIALPVIGMQLMEMVYNLADMFWLGKLGTEALAATATCGMYIWLSMGFMVLGRIGAEIGVAQSIGAGEIKLAKHYFVNSFAISITLGVLVGLIMLFGNSTLIRFFNLDDPYVIELSERYLSISGIGVPFIFMSAVISGAFTGSGNSKLVFYINTSGIIFNLILDPITIFGLGMGVTGAAISNVLGQILSFTLLLIALYRHPSRPFEKINLWLRPQLKILKQIFHWGLPVMLEALLFPFLSMLITRVVAQWGPTAIAAQRIGTQAESLTWLIAGGFCTAFTSFVGQNFGANKKNRIRKGMRLSLIMLTIYGSIVSLFLYFFGTFIAGIFINDTAVIELSAKYLQISAFCQLMCCYEPLFSGYFRGIGLTMPPAVISIVINALRALAVYVGAYLGIDLIGIYWIITWGAIARGLLLVLWYLIKNRPRRT